MLMLRKVNYKALFLLFVIFLIALLVGGVFVYSVFFVAFIMILLAFYSGRKSYHNLVSIIWKNSDRIQVGERLKLTMEFYNSGIFPIPYLRVKTNLSKKLTGEEEKSSIYSVMTSEKIIIDKNILCKNKGVYKIGYIEVDFGDALGIFNWKKVFDTSIFLYVYPRIHELKSFALPLRQHFGTTPVRHKAYEDFASLRDIRKYNNGDNFKKIHWKVTAHKGEMHVKNLELNASADVHLFLDLDVNGYTGEYIDDMEEKAAECAISIIRYGLLKNMSVSFIAKDDKFVRITGNGIKRFDDFLDAVTRVEMKGNTPIWDLIKNEGQKLSLGATVILVTYNVHELLLEALLSKQAKGISFVVVYIYENEMVDDCRVYIETLRQRDIMVYQVELKDNIKQALGGNYER